MKLPHLPRPGVAAAALALAAIFSLTPLLAQTVGVEDYVRQVLVPPYPDTLDLTGNPPPYPEDVSPWLNQFTPEDLKTNPNNPPEIRELYEMGFVDVTAWPFEVRNNLDPEELDGSDSIVGNNTWRLKQAIEFARHFQMVCYFPGGTYLVNNTLECAQGYFRRSNGVGLTGDRLGPCILLGSRTGGRPVIRLADNSPGFGFNNPNVDPKPVVYFWARKKRGGSNKFTQSQPNISYHQKLINIDIEIGTGNPRANGIDHQGAQGCGIQGCKITFLGDGNAGVRGACGAGGSMAHIVVIGGTIGFDLISAQPRAGSSANGTMDGATLVSVRCDGQSGAAIQFSRFESLAVVGFSITRSSAEPAIISDGGTSQTSASNGRISLVDGKIDYTGAEAGDAITTDRPLYLRDVWVRNAANIIRSTSTLESNENKLPIASIAPAEWVHCEEVSYTLDLPFFIHNKNNWEAQFYAPRYVLNASWEEGGGPFGGDQKDMVVDSNFPPNLVYQHRWWPNFPHFEESNITNVKDFGAAGDGFTDDTDAIQAAIDNAPPNGTVFLPKGLYRISRSLQLGDGTRIIGAAETCSILVADHRVANGQWDTTAVNPESDFRDPNPGNSNFMPGPSDARPMIRTSDSSEAVNIVAYLGFFASHQVPCAYPIEWLAGRDTNGQDSILLSPYFRRIALLGYGNASVLKAPNISKTYTTDFPLLRVTGNGGGKFYNLVHGSSVGLAPRYRQLFVANTTDRLQFYGCNPEYATNTNPNPAEAAAQFANAQDFHIYGLKGEGRRPVLWIQDSNDFRVFSFGGNANGASNDTLFQLDDCDNFLLSNMTERPRANPANWFSIVETLGEETLPTERVWDEDEEIWLYPRPVFYRRGQPAEDY